MMATEAIQENFADASNPTGKQNVLTEPQQDVPSISPPPPVNGEAPATDGDKLEKDKPVQSTSAAASISGGSDTEASKGENTKLQTDDKGHARASSAIKKPTTFKAVTVNKTFLAAKGATPSAASKLGENKPAAGTTASQSGPSVSAAPRPRLVAKTGSGLRESTPRSSASVNGGKPGSAPDPGAVWNKNRPPPPPEVKRLTDEDLRRKYGIHLATRIQGDDQGKQANWADIDEDEDDWAPETIEWNDGTKITLPSNDEPAPAPVEQAQPKAIMATGSSSKPVSPALPNATTSTVKLGGISGGPGKGLVLKGAAEKPTLVAKPPGPPTPVKSPWAPLPPVDKVAPVVIEPKVSQPQQAPPRFHQKDPHGFESMPPKPTKEIAADDFSRGWRDNSQNQNRELFNSQSGRYEPVTDNRRNSRNDIHSRQPALLQRPHHDQSGPAEPSGAFQTHRTSGESTYGRRRNSSNVSGGSGNVGRRVSFSRGGDMPAAHEMTGPRRGSLAAVSDSPSSPRNFSPAVPYQGQRNGQPWQSRASPATSNNSPNLMHGQLVPPAVQSGTQLPPVEDEVELQKKVMADSREAARKRRAEAIAKEEAEKQERIRQKLDSMGPPPMSNKMKKEASAEEKVTPTQIQVRSPVNVPAKPSPEMTAEAKAPSDAKAENAVSKPSGERGADAQKTLAEDSAFGRSVAPEERRNVADHILPSSQSTSAAPPWQGASQTNRFPAWNGNSQPSTTRNVWGHQGIGNGSFGVQETAGSQGGPGSVSLSNSYRPNNQQSGRGREQYNARPGPIAPPNSQSGPQRSARHPPQNQIPNPWAGLDIAARDREMDAARAQEIAARREREALEGVKEPERIDTWKRVDLQANGERTRVKTTNTTTKPATVNGIVAEESGPSSRFMGANPLAPNGVRHDAIGGPVMTSAPTQRVSRFFSNSRDVRLEESNLQEANYSFGRSSSPSPPPPTMAGHPAYDGDSSHPHVSLPMPAPVVRLPPAKQAPIGPPAKAPSFAAAVAGPSRQSAISGVATTQRSSQDIRQHGLPMASGQDWQNRINGLFGKPSPPKSYALAVNSSFAVNSSSKHALEISEAQNPATVTLPGSRSDGVWDQEESFTTKPESEECFEEQEMGSRPVCNLPRPPPPTSWTSPAQRKPDPPKTNTQKPRAPDVCSVPRSVEFYTEKNKEGPVVAVFFPGMTERKSIQAPRLNTSQRNNSGRNNTRGGRGGGSTRGGSSYNRGNGRRETSSNFPPSRVDNAPSSSTNGHSSGGHHSSRGRGRGYGASNWATRHVSTPVTTN